MKKGAIHILLFFIFIRFHSVAQYTMAGIPGSIYVDVVPDTLLNPVPNSWTTEGYSLDINQDGTNDISIACSAGASPGGGSFRGTVTSLDSNFKFSFQRVDSTQYYPGCGTGWLITGTVLKPYVAGDTIKAGVYVNSGVMALSGYNMNCYNYSDVQWVQSYDQYIGVRYTGGSVVSFGWIRVLVSATYVALVKDFSLGNYVVGLSESHKTTVKVSPNPASEEIFISGIEYSEISLLDITGREIKKTIDHKIDLSSVMNGMYVLSIRSTSGMISQKIIVQH